MPKFELNHLELPPRYLAMVQALLREYLPQAEVWAYGSRVLGGCYEASDLDLVVRKPCNLTEVTESLWEVQEAFIESDLPIQVQIVDWARIPVAFHKEIDIGYIVLQEPLPVVIEGGSCMICCCKAR